MAFCYGIAIAGGFLQNDRTLRCAEGKGGIPYGSAMICGGLMALAAFVLMRQGADENSFEKNT